MPQIILYVEINVFGLVVLAIVLFSQQRTGISTIPQRLFRGVLFSCGLMLLLDTGTWLLDGATFPGGRVLLYGFTLCYFIFTPLVAHAWLRYCDYYINADERRLLKRRLSYCVPFIINAALSVSSLWTGWLFTIDAGNVYHRGDWFVLHVVAAMVYMVKACVLIWRNTHVPMERRERLFLTLFMVPPMVGALLQWAFYGTALLWVFTVLAILFIYINVQNRQIFTDSLTGLNNRRRFTQYLPTKIHSLVPGERLFAMMIDLDHFKIINDQMGHMIGDRALMNMSEVLKATCATHNDFLARIGGDEFVLLCRRSNEAEMEETVDEIQRRVDAFNDGHTEEYKLSFSAGWAEFTPDTATAEAMISEADRRMYGVKAKKE